MLSQFRISFKDIRHAITEMDDQNLLDAEIVEKMIPQAPTADEMAKINAYEGEVAKLGKAEQY
eukprot:SAG31_NODE_8159_length_1507_cov_0.797585_1_plen_62_part_10